MEGEPAEVLSLRRCQGICTLSETPMPQLSDNQVLVEVSVAAICLTDLYAANGVIPCRDGIILGHEFVGRVVAMGEAVRSGAQQVKVSLGSRVAVMPYIPCGDCIDCNNGLSWQCSRAQMLGVDTNGGFSEYVAVPSSQVYPIDNDLSDKLNAFAEPVAAAMSVLQAPIEAEHHIWLCGAGRIVHLCAFILKQHGFNNITFGLTPPSDPFDALILVEQPTALFAADSTGQWLDKLHAGGLLVLKTRTPEPLLIPINRLIQKRLTIHAVNYAPMPQALQFIAQHGDFFAGLAGPVFSLKQHQQAFAEAAVNKEQKVFLQIKES